MHVSIVLSLLRAAKFIPRTYCGFE
jgi:hypothetical protein